jgi:hypothetical protein
MTAKTLFEHAANCKIILDRAKEYKQIAGLRSLMASNLWRLHVDGTLWPGPWNTTRSVREIIRKMTAEDLGQNIQSKKSTWHFFSEQAYLNITAGIAVNKTNYYVEHTVPCEHLKNDLAALMMEQELSVKEIAEWVMDHHVACLLVKGQEIGVGKHPNWERPFQRYGYKIVNADGVDVTDWTRNDIIVFAQSKYSDTRQAFDTFSEEQALKDQREFLESGRAKEVLRETVWYRKTRTEQFNEAYSDFKNNYTKDYFNYGN